MQNMLLLMDIRGRYYYSELKNCVLNLEIGMNLRLRSVQIVVGEKQSILKFFEYCSVIEIPSHFKDSHDLEEAFS